MVLGILTLAVSSGGGTLTGKWQEEAPRGDEM